MDLTPRVPSEQFLRGQRRAQKASRRLGRLVLRRVAILFGLLATAALAVWAAALAGRAPELAVNRVFVEGNERLTRGEILELLELDRQYNTLTLDLEEVRRRLLRSAWVRDVEVTRVLPATLTLDIEERRPSAVAILDEPYLLAGDGTVLDQLSPQYDISKLVVARGLTDAEGGLSAERAALAGRIASALASDEKLLPLVSEVDVAGGPSSVSLTLRAPPIFVLATDATLLARLNELAPMLEALSERFPELDVVDLRFSGRVYLQLRPSTPGETIASARFAPGGASF